MSCLLLPSCIIGRVTGLFPGLNPDKQAEMSQKLHVCNDHMVHASVSFSQSKIAAQVYIMWFSLAKGMSYYDA